MNITVSEKLAFSEKLVTAEIQSAIDECFLSGGGEVIIPKGEYLVASLRLRSNVTLHLLEGAVLKGSIDPEDYYFYLDDKIEPIPKDQLDMIVPTAVMSKPQSRTSKPYSRWNNAIIRAINAKNISIIGEKGSIIDGQNCYDEQGEEDYRGPHAINMWFCENITLKGYTIIDSANWAHAIHNSSNITLKDVTVLGGHDGFDIRTCDNTVIERCTFKTGDDCIAGFDNLNVTVRNCYFESGCSMLRFGGTNVVVDNCEGKAPATYGFRGVLSKEDKQTRASSYQRGRTTCKTVFLYYCDYRAEIRETPGNIIIKNSRFHNPETIFALPFGHIWCCNRSLHDITFENCTFDYVGIPTVISAPEDEPLTLIFTDCQILLCDGSIWEYNEA